PCDQRHTLDDYFIRVHATRIEMFESGGRGFESAWPHDSASIACPRQRGDRVAQLMSASGTKRTYRGLPANVRFWGQSGHGRSDRRMSGSDPKRTWAP